MAAITTRLLHLRPIIRPHPYTLHHFSSSSDQPESERESESISEASQNQNKPSFSSYFSDVKSSLQREPPPQNRLRRPHSFPNPNAPPQTSPPPSKLASLEEIRRNLSEYRLRSAPPPPSSASSAQHVSFQEIFKRNILPKPGDPSPVGQPSLSSVGERMRQLRATDPNQNGIASKPLDFSRLKEDLKLGKLEGGNYSASFAWNSKKESDENAAGAMRRAFFRSYKHPELGKQLQMLRPEKRKGNWFSLQELNDRLVRLREIEKEESQKKLRGVGISDLRESLEKVMHSDNEKKRINTVQRLDALSNLGATPSYMLYPPKEQLVDQYFHPDNMSSAEKLKLELKKVRDEFKMSESDCGSARVQVAQLTTKIKHLSTVLAKKDKHSRKGLQAMVQKRKKLLKYLRRTDWDSYSLVLSKLGLRDNPDIKA